MPTMCRATSANVAALLMYRRQVYAVCATHLLRGCAPYGARSPSGASTAVLAGTPIPTQLQAMLPGTRNQAGVTRPILSQSSDSTSRLGRDTEGNDAQSRPGAGCKPARRHRTRSASESALAKASLDERDWNNVTENRTAVKRDTVIVTISVNPSVRESDILPIENHYYLPQYSR